MVVQSVSSMLATGRDVVAVLPLPLMLMLVEEVMLAPMPTLPSMVGAIVLSPVVIVVSLSLFLESPPTSIAASGAKVRFRNVVFV